jgi:hypothetical protein
MHENRDVPTIEDVQFINMDEVFGIHRTHAPQSALPNSRTRIDHFSASQIVVKQTRYSVCDFPGRP